MQVKTILKKFTAATLAASFAVALLPNLFGNTVMADTVKNKSNTCLGVSGITKPSKPASDSSYWSGSYVYFGTYEGNPIKYRVLAKGSTVHTSSKCLFLDCDTVLFSSEFDNASNKWKGSDLKEYLNNDFLIGFTDVEQDAIASSKISSHTYQEGTTAGKVSNWTANYVKNYIALTGEKVFVLDAEDASNISYGYSVSDERCNNKIKTGAANGNWWLRSIIQSSTQLACSVDSSGEISGETVSSTDAIGVAPAMNIKQSTIMFSTAVSGDMGAAGTEYKLTLLDDSIECYIPEDVAPFIDGSYVYLYTEGYNYSRTSVLILDKEYGTSGAQILFYDDLYNESIDDFAFDFGSTGLDLNEWGSSYHVYIIGELTSDSAYETDYASTPVEVDVPIQQAQPEDFLSTGVAHVQDKGNVTSTVDSEGFLTLGTVGEGKRLESITINFTNPTPYSGTLQYRVHVQDIGWMDWVDAGSPAGTSGQSKRIEAIEMRLTGELADYYSVEYCVHIQDYGYNQGWVKDGALAGTTGESKRIEEITLWIVPQGWEDYTYVKYRVHVQDFGWESEYAYDGEMSGTSGQAKRLEGIEICLEGLEYSGGIRYKTHVQDYGWETSWSYDGEMSGTQGESKRLEGIMIELYGEIADYYDVYYRVHAEDIGWLSWACNGDPAGTAGRSARLEAIQIVLVPKGEPVPGNTYMGITSVDPMCFVEGFDEPVG